MGTLIQELYPNKNGILLMILVLFISFFCAKYYRKISYPSFQENMQSSYTLSDLVKNHPEKFASFSTAFGYISHLLQQGVKIVNDYSAEQACATFDHKIFTPSDINTESKFYRDVNNIFNLQTKNYNHDDESSINAYTSSYNLKNDIYNIVNQNPGVCVKQTVVKLKKDCDIDDLTTKIAGPEGTISQNEIPANVDSLINNFNVQEYNGELNHNKLGPEVDKEQELTNNFTYKIEKKNHDEIINLSVMKCYEQGWSHPHSEIKLDEKTKNQKAYIACHGIKKFPELFTDKKMWFNEYCTRTNIVSGIMNIGTESKEVQRQLDNDSKNKTKVEEAINCLLNGKGDDCNPIQPTPPPPKYRNPGESCNDTDKKCKGRLQCIGPNLKKRCGEYVTHGMTCNDSDRLCKRPLKCGSSGTCILTNVKRGNKCNDSNRLCAPSLQCVGSGKFKKCQPKSKSTKVLSCKNNEDCNNPNKFCYKTLPTNTHGYCKNKAGRGESCEIRPCEPRLECKTNGTNKTCQPPTTATGNERCWHQQEDGKYVPINYSKTICDQLKFTWAENPNRDIDRKTRTTTGKCWEFEQSSCSYKNKDNKFDFSYKENSAIVNPKQCITAQNYKKDGNGNYVKGADGNLEIDKYNAFDYYYRVWEDEKPEDFSCDGCWRWKTTYEQDKDTKRYSISSEKWEKHTSEFPCDGSNNPYYKRSQGAPGMCWWAGCRQYDSDERVKNELRPLLDLDKSKCNNGNSKHPKGYYKWVDKYGQKPELNYNDVNNTCRNL